MQKLRLTFSPWFSVGGRAGKKLTFLASLIIKAGRQEEVAAWEKVVINYRNGKKLNWANIQVNYESKVNEVRQEKYKIKRN